MQDILNQKKSGQRKRKQYPVKAPDNIQKSSTVKDKLNLVKKQSWTGQYWHKFLLWYIVSTLKFLFGGRFKEIVKLHIYSI